MSYRFSEGLALQFEHKLVDIGYFNEIFKGNFVIKHQFDEANNFN